MWEWLTTSEEGGAVTCYYITSLSPSQPPLQYSLSNNNSVHKCKCPVHSHGSKQVPSPFTWFHTSAQSIHIDPHKCPVLYFTFKTLHCRIPLKCHMDPKTCVPSHDPKTCVPSHDLRPVSLHMTLRPVSLHMTLRPVSLHMTLRPVSLHMT